MKDYNSIQFLLNKISGFGWDDERKVVTADDSVWEELLKVRLRNLIHFPAFSPSPDTQVLREVEREILSAIQSSWRPCGRQAGNR